MKFSFKTEKPTGRYKSFSKENYYIKIKGKIVGSIDSDIPFRIRFQIKKVDIMEDGNPNCPWKWILLVKKSASLEEAKVFIRKNNNVILEKFPIWMNGEEGA